MKKIIRGMLVLASMLTLTACGNKDVSKLESNKQFSYNITQRDPNSVSKLEMDADNLNEIFNISRGYIEAWNKNNTEFMKIVFDDNVNNIKKETYINSYIKDFSRLYRKKHFKNVTVIDYNKNSAKIKICYDNKKANKFMDYKENQEENILYFVNKNNKWLITNIEICGGK